MATSGDRVRSVSNTGQLLAALRAERGLTAAQLADLVPSSEITSTVITNVESGRKRDLTVNELVLISAALDVSPLALVVDIRHPWEAFPYGPLPATHTGITNAEYLRIANAFSTVTDPRNSVTLQPAEAQFINELCEGEQLANWVDAHLAGDNDPDEAWERAQWVVDRYRYVLGWRLRLNDAARPMDKRVEALRHRVAAYLERWPDLDYGQSDQPSQLAISPELNPRNARVRKRG